MPAEAALRKVVLGRATLISYGLPGLVTAIPTVPVFTLVPTFYAQDVGLGLALTGVMLFVGRVLDLISDPLVGLLADLWAGGRGLATLVLTGGLIGAPALVLLLSPPAGMSTAAGAGWLLGFSTLLYLGWTLVQVPYLTWGARLSQDYHQRTRLTASREGWALGGIMLSASLPAILGALALDEGQRLAALGWFAVALGLPAFYLLLRRVPPPLPMAHAGSGWRGITDNRLFLRLLGSWFINGLANGIPAVLFPLYCAYVLAADDQTRNLLLALYFGCAVAGIPCWLMLSRRLSRHRAWALAMAITCPAFAFAALLGPGDVGAFALICVVTGLCLGADLALPPAIQADVADWDRLRFRRNRTAGLFALWGMATKLALALAAGLTLPALGAIGLGGEAPPTVALTALALTYALIPCVLKLIAVALMHGLPLTRARQAAVAARLSRRDLAATEA
jgi:glycoside/pentoside/hexuronide:cation symporter, GPH family